MAYKPKILAPSEGGTGAANTATSGKVLIGDGTNFVTSTPSFPNTSATSGKILISDGTNFVASTPTYPNSASGTGTILRADGTNWVATTSTYPNTNAVNTLLYASSANVMAALATANSGVLSTNSSGVPSIDTTNFAVLSTGLQLKGNNTNTAPPAGFIGEHIRSAVAKSNTSVSNNTPVNVTSISLTAGIWDVSAIGIYANAVITGTFFGFSINTTSATNGTFGDNAADTGTAPISTADVCLTIPAYRITLSSTTTVYLVAYALFSVGTLTAGGRISATRAG